MRAWGIVAIGLAACHEVEPGPPSALLLVLDGVRTDEFTELAVSPLTGATGECWAEGTWATFAAEGTVVRATVNTGITVTAPAHAQMLTGRVDAFANLSVPEDGPGFYLPEYPTVFEEVRAQLALGPEDVHLLANSELLEQVQASTNPTGGPGASHLMVADGGQPAREDRPVLEALQAVIDADEPRLVVVNFHDSDRAGHFGESPDYADGVLEVDGLLAELHAWIAEEHPGWAENLLVIVTSDHGRHRDYREEGWRNHGDACAGCREVPLVVRGPGVSEGVVTDGTWTGIDLGPTLAAHLGAQMPWAQGLPMASIVPGLVDATVRSGETDLVADGAHVATRRFLDDPAQRSEVLVDGEVVSTPGVFAAEAPALLDTGEAVYTCFRELALDPGEEEWPWRARCLASKGTGWSEIGFAEEDVGPLFRPVLLPWGDDGLVALWGHNPNAIAELGVDGDVGLWAATWTPGGGWGAPAVLEAYFPTHVAALRTSEGAVAAFTTNQGDITARATRHTRVARWDGEGLVALADVSLASVLGEGSRGERPALARDGDVLRLALLGTGPGGQGVYVAESTDEGASWSEPVALPEAGVPFPNVAPAWDAGVVAWAALVDGAAVVCRAAPSDATALCEDVASPRVDGLAIGADGVLVTRDAEVGRWETAAAGR